jgi:nitroimidazol reductase NimA-like FMN-containing flavoprotein (pyridoxamine 5'-phosphate oxidase superfamily)
MTKDYTTLPYNQVRRQDREVTDDAWIKALLHRAPVGYLATVNEGQPFINSNIFVYDEAQNVLYMHTARVGRTQGNVDAGSPICFTVTEMGRLLPADVALEFSVEYTGVVVFGTAVIVTDETEAHLKLGQDYRPPVPEELKRTAVFRINIEQVSGKKKEVAADFPGAYFYEDVVEQYFFIAESAEAQRKTSEEFLRTSALSAVCF